MNFEVYGPFLLNAEPVEKGFSWWIDKEQIKDFWDKVRPQNENLEKACGVYIFSVQGKLKRKGKTADLPWPKDRY